jgi:2-C-methyl-D-erythritol 2,4-cyclodiphosphate synthase
MLGALAMGDIGDLFPNTDPRWKNAASVVFVTEACKRMTRAGYRIGNVDLTILAEKPKLKGFKQPMREKLAGMLGTAVDQINVKAGTNEECDAIGRGEAIAAHAVVLLLPQ